jgi:hypothetical protein
MNQRPGMAVVERARAMATWGIRAVALIMLASGAYFALNRIVFALFVADFQAAFRTWTEVGEGHSASRGVALLAALSRRIARWVIALPQAGCPGCGYPRADAAGVCPECGLDQS